MPLFTSIYRDHHNNHTLPCHKILVSEMKMNTQETSKITATTPRNQNEASIKKKKKKKKREKKKWITRNIKHLVSVAARALQFKPLVQKALKDWANKPTPTSEIVGLGFNVVKFFGKDEAFCMWYIVIMFNMIAV